MNHGDDTMVMNEYLIHSKENMYIHDFSLFPVRNKFHFSQIYRSEIYMRRIGLFKLR